MSCTTDRIGTIKLEGRSVTIPKLLGKEDVFSALPFFLEKPRWVPDDEVINCPVCGLKFSQLRRKHHCRNCGRIYCAKCCNHKLLLPQFGYEDAQKVCSDCYPTCELIAKSRGEYVAFRQEAARGLQNMTDNTNNVIRLIESGGIPTLIFLASQGDNIIKECVASSIHSLAQFIPVLNLLKICGAIKALKHFLVTSDEQLKILTESLSALSLFCKTTDDKMAVIKEDVIEPLLKLLERKDTISLLAGRVICYLVENLDHHSLLLQNISVMHRLLNCLKTTDTQKQQIVMKTLAYISTSNETYRHRLIQEDEVLGNPILNVLKNSDIHSLLISAVCVVGNLAANVGAQNALQAYLTAVANLLDNFSEGPKELINHISRTLANFSEFPASSLLLVQRLPSIVSVLLRSDVEVQRIHACRIIIFLWNAEPTVTLEALMKNGADTFLEELLVMDGVVGVLNNVLLRKTSRLSFPL